MHNGCTSDLDFLIDSQSKCIIDTLGAKLLGYPSFKPRELDEESNSPLNVSTSSRSSSK